MIGILYESNEWSDWKLRHELECALGEPVSMIDMECAGALDAARTCEMLISRVFASAVFRGHETAAANMVALVDEATAKGMPMVNPPQAHRYEISKAKAARALEAAGLAVPRIQALGTPEELMPQTAQWEYPCIIKPDCGGRTTHTAILHTAEDADAFLAQAPAMVFIVEDYIAAKSDYLTRVELVDGNVALVVKRSIAASGLSSYHEGSTYGLYPECSPSVLGSVQKAGKLLSIGFGSFDVIEGADGEAYIIDANSVSNVSEDCTEMFQLDLMREYAQAIAHRVKEMRRHGRRP